MTVESSPPFLQFKWNGKRKTCDRCRLEDILCAYSSSKPHKETSQKARSTKQLRAKSPLFGGLFQLQTSSDPATTLSVKDTTDMDVLLSESGSYGLGAQDGLRKGAYHPVIKCLRTNPLTLNDTWNLQMTQSSNMQPFSPFGFPETDALLEYPSGSYPSSTSPSGSIQATYMQGGFEAKRDCPWDWAQQELDNMSAQRFAIMKSHDIYARYPRTGIFDLSSTPSVKEQDHLFPEAGSAFTCPDSTLPFQPNTAASQSAHRKLTDARAKGIAENCTSLCSQPSLRSYEIYANCPPVDLTDILRKTCASLVRRGTTLGKRQSTVSSIK